MYNKQVRWIAQMFSCMHLIFFEVQTLRSHAECRIRPLDRRTSRCVRVPGMLASLLLVVLAKAVLVSFVWVKLPQHALEAVQAFIEFA